MYVDRFIENCPIALHNLNSEAITGKVKDQWKNVGKNYDILNQESDFHKSRKYYARFEYKYTSTTTTISRLLIYFGGGGGENGTSGSFSVTSGDPATHSFVGTFDPEFKDSRAFLLYQGVNPNPSDLVGYLRNVLLYDVTDLWAYLKAKGTVTDSSSSFKTWADTNLEWRPYGESYTPTGVFADTLDSVSINKGTVIAQELVEADGMTARTVIQPYSSRVLDPYFDTDKYPYYAYNNLGNGNVTLERVDAMAQGSPLAPEHKYVLKITTNGEATPEAGGVYPDYVPSSANRVYIRKIVAKIPVGYAISAQYNPMGVDRAATWLTSQDGTGKWEEYMYEEHSGATGQFSNFGHMSLWGPDNQHVTWYVAYYDVVDITDNPALRGYTVLPNVHAIGKGTLFMREMNEVDLFPAGRTVKPEPGMLPSGWTYDAEDYVGDAKYSIVIPVGKSGGFPQNIPVDPSVKYKISMWIKCKAESADDVRPAIIPYTKDDVVLQAPRVFYHAGPTSLTADLNTGDMVVKVSDTSTFQSGTGIGLGFRGHWGTVEGYNRLGTIYPSDPAVFTVTDSTTLTLSKPYSGAKIPKGALVVDSLNGSYYPYPFWQITSSEYTWKYVEAYFGVDGALNDGKGGINWDGYGLSKATEYIRFQPTINTNKTNDPIKICDVRIRPYKQADGNGRLQGDVELKAYS